MITINDLRITYIKTVRQINRQTGRQTVRLTGRWTDRQTGRRADRQANRQYKENQSIKNANPINDLRITYKINLIEVFFLLI